MAENSRGIMAGTWRILVKYPSCLISQKVNTETTTGEVFSMVCDHLQDLSRPQIHKYWGEKKFTVVLFLLLPKF